MNNKYNDTVDFDVPEFFFNEDELDQISGKFPDPAIPDFDDDGLMHPPWVKFPNISYGSIGWRMSTGEAYMDKFSLWFLSSDSNIQNKVMNKYPADDEWNRYYSMLMNKLD